MDCINVLNDKLTRSVQNCILHTEKWFEKKNILNRFMFVCTFNFLSFFSSKMKHKKAKILELCYFYAFLHDQEHTFFARYVRSHIYIKFHKYTSGAHSIRGMGLSRILSLAFFFFSRTKSVVCTSVYNMRSIDIT